MEIFNFFYENENNLLSKLSKKDLEEFLRLLKLYKIGYRNLLDLQETSTYGLEIEFSSKNTDTLNQQLNEYNLNLINNDNKIWIIKKENSINDGHEICSPILRNNVESWKQIKDICNIIENNNCEINLETSAHVHIGDEILGNNSTNWLNFLKLYIAYENIIYRFSYGEYECERWSLPNYASPSAKELERYIRNTDEKQFNTCKLFFSPPLEHKKHGICIRKPTMDTIEFRCANGTLNPIIWQNNINFYEHFLRYATNPNFNYETINMYRKLQDYSSTSLITYNQININQAIELADLIFNNNLDKINFLRQYLKDFDTKNTFTKVKSFTQKHSLI